VAQKERRPAGRLVRPYGETPRRPPTAPWRLRESAAIRAATAGIMISGDSTRRVATSAITTAVPRSKFCPRAVRDLPMRNNRAPSCGPSTQRMTERFVRVARTVEFHHELEKRFASHRRDAPSPARAALIIWDCGCPGLRRRTAQRWSRRSHDHPIAGQGIKRHARRRALTRGGVDAARPASIRRRHRAEDLQARGASHAGDGRVHRRPHRLFSNPLRLAAPASRRRSRASSISCAAQAHVHPRAAGITGDVPKLLRGEAFWERWEPTGGCDARELERIQTRAQEPLLLTSGGSVPSRLPNILIASCA